MPSSLSPQQIGYLRKAPPPGSGPVSGSGPVLAMWRKLSAAGLMDEIPAGRVSLYRRSDRGQDAIECFDASLPQTVRAVLEALMAGGPQNRITSMPGTATALACGLVSLEEAAHGFVYELHADARKQEPESAPPGRHP